jgi:hypothetical protein
MNNIAEIKSTLHQFIAENDDIKFLTELKNFMRSEMEKKEKIIAYTSKGLPLTQSAYKKEIDDAIAEIESGQFISQEEMNKKIKKSI